MRAAIGSVVPVESVNYEMVEKEVGTFFGKKLYEKSFIIRENGVNSSNWSGSPGVAPTFTYNGIEMDNWSEVVDYSLIAIRDNYGTYMPNIYIKYFYLKND